MHTTQKIAYSVSAAVVYSSTLWCYTKMSGQFHIPADLLRGQNSWCPLCRRLCGPELVCRQWPLTGNLT